MGLAEEVVAWVADDGSELGNSESVAVGARLEVVLALGEDRVLVGLKDDK